MSLDIYTGLGIAFGSLCFAVLPIILRLLPKKQVIQDVSPAILDFLGENTKAVVNLEKTFAKSIDQNERTHENVNFIETITKRNGERIDVVVKDVGEIKAITSETNNIVVAIKETQGQIATKIFQ